MNGVALCCRFSNVTNRLNYCGPLKAHEIFERFMKSGEGEKEVQGLLSRFESVFPYLQFIAKKHNLQPFDEKVVEAYWIGNELLDAFTAVDFKSFLPELGKRGLPAKIVEQLQDEVPEGALPCHAFHVLFVGVGRVSGKVSTTFENMTNCIVRWGEVVEILPDGVSIRGFSLSPDHKLGLESADFVAVFNPGLINPVVGDCVAVHWNEAVHVLDKKQAENLGKYTEKVISSLSL